MFESLVEKTMPVLWDHLVKSDVQLSVVSLPWFLSLFINSMPLVFAFRVLDVFFLEGAKVLFQVGLAILRINGEELLDVTDDGTFISILKNYFSRLDESAHPKSENVKLRSVTRFQELMVVAFKEFAGITQSTISDQRSKHKDAVLDNIESFAKRTSIRNLGPDSKRLSLDDLGLLYDRFYGILYERQQRMQLLREESDRRARAGVGRTGGLVASVTGPSSVEMGRVGLGPSPTLMNYDGFREFLAGIARWAITDAPTPSQKDSALEKENHTYAGNSTRKRSLSLSPWGTGNPEPADHDFMQRLYGRWNKNDNDGLSLQNVVSGLALVKGTRDIMTSISYFFDLYDDEQDGRVDREGILRISEALLFLTRRGLEGSLTPSSSTNGFNESIYSIDNGLKSTANASTDERFLSSISAFIRRCFEYADPDHRENETNEAHPISGVDTFSIGDDDDEDILDLEESSEIAPRETKSANMQFHAPNYESIEPRRQQPLPDLPKSSSQHSANLALDPAHPLHITLPTFRMVILADELLQQFFESWFPESFRLSPPPSSPLQRSPTTSSTQSSSLTTFSSLNSQTAPVPVIPNGGVVPPSKGLRGVLDNIVSDGMRVAAEVRKRVDEAQREAEKNAMARGEDDEDDDDERKTSAVYSIDSDRKSVREDDRDLLEGAEAEFGLATKGSEEVPTSMEKVNGLGGKLVEFER